MGHYLYLALKKEQLQAIIDGQHYTETRLAGSGKRSVFVDLTIVCKE